MLNNRYGNAHHFFCESVLCKFRISIEREKSYVIIIIISFGCHGNEINKEEEEDDSCFQIFTDATIQLN